MLTSSFKLVISLFHFHHGATVGVPDRGEEHRARPRERGGRGALSLVHSVRALAGLAGGQAGPRLLLTGPGTRLLAFSCVELCVCQFCVRAFV